MSGSAKPQRIRDPLHNLVVFETDQFERTLWRIVQSRPFQRLRRVRQLGFSEFVFPGATHTRFVHSIGVFHIARQLVQVVKRHLGHDVRNHQCDVALAAALVHDVGHGMFSHAFEGIGKELKLPMARHETVSEQLIRGGELGEVFKELGSGFADDVADVLKREEPGNLYDSVVSSQFDADRLDYMQRDRLMTGIQSSGIDATWLVANLEIGSIASTADDEQSGNVETLVLGPKAFHAAENYVLSLFQLYPNVYLHKTTRGAEKLFSCLMLQVIGLIQAGDIDQTGLPKAHPICRFAQNPDDLDSALGLDDAVFWGALPLMAEAQDPQVGCFAVRLIERRLPKCIDIRRVIEQKLPARQGMTTEDRYEREAILRLNCKRIVEKVKEVSHSSPALGSSIMVDESRRNPYKKFQDSKTALNQILIRQGENRIEDMAHLSPVVSSAEAFEVCRAYYTDGDTEGKLKIENIIRTCDEGLQDG